MARRKSALPAELGRAPFSVTRARASGVSAHRVRDVDLARPFRGVRSANALTDVESVARAYLERMPSHTLFGGRTAAALMSAPLPHRLRHPLPLEVVVPRPGRAPRGQGISGRSLELFGTPRTLARLPTVSPEDAWVRLAPQLRLGELVAAGDYLIRPTLGWVTRERLAGAVTRVREGAVLLRQALELLDERAESAPESELRVILVRAGFTGFVPDLEMVLDGRLHRVDLAFPAQRVALEYQGDYHRDPVQWRRDVQRRARLESAGWTVIEVVWEDLAESEDLVRRIRRALAR